MSLSSGGLSRIRIVIQWLLVLWSAALVFYFEVKEGLIRWGWLFEPATGGFFRDHGLPDPRLERPFSADAPVAPYVQILKNAMGPYNIQWENAPWAALGIAAGMICAYVLLGWMLLAAFRMYVPRGAKACLALVIGCGAVGIGGELLAMANRLQRMPVAAMWGVLALVGLIMWVVAWRRRYTVQDFSAHTRLTPREQAGLARQWYESMHPWPAGKPGMVLAAVYVLLFAIITALVTLHAIGEPVSYWDSLILYVGYARAIYLQGDSQ